MIKDALRYIVEMRKPEIIHANGVMYSDKRLEQIEAPKFPTLEVNSLSAVAAYIQKVGNEKWGEEHPIIVHIEDERTVTLKDVSDGCCEKRDVFLRSCAEVPSFEYGRFYDRESFNIQMQSKFAETDDRGAILQVVGNLRDEAVQTMADDGCSQSVTIRTGVAAVGTARVPSPAELRPYRTFLEVEQPMSRFVFRMRDGGACALFEADGGAWKLEAKKLIYLYLSDALEKEIEGHEVVLIA